MKKLLFLILFPLSIFSLSSCSKKTDPEITNAIQQSSDDDAAIKAYITAHPEITNVKDTLGIYYQVIAIGGGANIDDNTKISASYTGTLLNGTVFDSSTNLNQYVRNLIVGWRVVLPKVTIGSKVLMLIPSRYGYGTTSTDKVPANSVLIFNVDLTPSGI